jgi:alpha-beta hydrolase superfamily lysophospholipase
MRWHRKRTQWSSSTACGHTPKTWARWQGFFGNAGYDTMAPGWSGDEDTVELARAHPDTVANYGIDDVTEHYATINESCPAPPILIGHSFGGMIAEKLLGDEQWGGCHRHRCRPDQVRAAAS